MKIIDYIIFFCIILLFITVASCSKEESMCIDYELQDEELLNKCVDGICTQIVQVTTTCISYEGK